MSEQTPGLAEDSKDHRAGDAPPRLLQHRLGCLVEGGLWLVTFVVSFWLQSPLGTFETRWTPARGQDGLEYFQYLVYPRRDDVALHSTKGGKATGVLSRAVLTDPDSMEPGGWVHVADATGGSWVRAEDLQFLPPVSAKADYLAALQRRLAEHLEGKPIGIQVSFDTKADGTTKVMLELRPDMYIEFYEYTIHQGIATPQARRVLSGKAMAFLLPFKLLGSLVFATVAVVVVVVGTWLLSVRTYRIRQKRG